MLQTPKPPGAGNAVHVLNRLLRDMISPSLRELGFKGSGRRFALHAHGSDDHALLGIQANRYNDWSLARFTLNVSFYTEEEWAGVQAERLAMGMPAPSTPSPNEEYFCGWSARVGYLYEPAHDHWWAVRDEAGADVVAADVIHVVDAFVKPQLTARLMGEEPPPTFSQSQVRCTWADCPGSMPA